MWLLLVFIVGISFWLSHKLSSLEREYERLYMVYSGVIEDYNDLLRKYNNLLGDVYEE